MNARRVNEIFITWALLVSAATTLFFWSPALDVFNLPKTAVLLIGSAGVVGGAFYLFKYNGLNRRVGLAIYGLAILFYLIQIFFGPAGLERTLWGAYSRANGAVSYLSIIILAITVLVSARLANINRVFQILLVALILNTMYGYLQLSGNDFVNWVNPYNPIIGTLGNPNFSSSILGLTSLATLIYATFASKSNYLRTSLAILAILGVVLAYLTESIQGPITFAVGLTVAFLGAFWIAKRKVIFYSLSALVVVGGTFLIYSMYGYGPLGATLFQYTLKLRFRYWQAAIEMMQNHPWLGVGVDSYGEYFRRSKPLALIQSNGPELMTNNAHSTPFQLGATMGVPFFLLYVGLQIYVIIRFIKAFKTPTASAKPLLGLFAIWMAFQLQSLISLDQLGLSIWGWVLGAAIIGLSFDGETAVIPVAVKGPKKIERTKEVPPAFLKPGIAIGAIVGFMIALTPIRADLAMKAAIETPWSQEDEPSKQTRLANLTASIKSLEHDPTYVSQAITEVYKMGKIDEGLALAKEGAALHPESFDSQFMVVDMLEQNERWAEALPYRKRTTELDPMNWNVWMAYARDLENTGDKAGAKIALNKVLEFTNDPKFIADAKNGLIRLGS
jgi:O-antigen ligase